MRKTQELQQEQKMHQSKCFQMLGFDIMLDVSGKAQLLEVNTHPSFAWDTSIDGKSGSQFS
jgi:tubulin polyglutamylase TTLL11